MVLASGGARGVCALGAASALKDAGFFDAVQTYSGTSVGALIAAGLALGRHPKAMLAAALRHPMQPDLVPGTYGMDRGRGLARFVNKVLGLRRKVTFAEVPNLRVCVYNASRKRPEYWDRTTHPDVSIAFAVRVSCTVPFVFGAVRFRGDLYVDGAVADPVPVRAPQRTLAVRFAPRPVDDTLESFTAALRYVEIKSAKWSIELTTDLQPLAFDAPPHALRRAFEDGKAQASQFVKKNL